MTRTALRRALGFTALGVALAAPGATVSATTVPTDPAGSTPTDSAPADSTGEMPAEGAMPPMFPDTCEVVAEGLSDPRNIVVSEDGTVYVTEAGNGGDEVVGGPPPEEGAAPAGTEPAGTEGAGTEPAGTDAADEGTAPAGSGAPGEGEADGPPPTTRGPSGQVTMIAPDGTQSVLVEGLPSYAGVGPVGLVEADGSLWVSIGGGAIGTASATGTEIEELEYENSIVRIDPATGEVTEVAALGEYELENNPDGTDVNPNLYGMTLGPDGMLYVADAGGNTIYSVDPASGEFEEYAVVPTLSVLTGGEPPADPMADRQPVPIAPFFDADGVFHVTLLSEGWEGPNVLRLEDGSWTGVVTAGLEFVFDLTAGPDGSTYVTVGTTGFGDDGMPGAGFIGQIDDDGSITPVLEGLFVPHGSAVDAEGNWYSTINSISFDPAAPPSGMVVRCAPPG